MKYRDNFFSVAHFWSPWPPSSVLYKTRHMKENNIQHQRQRWTNSQECLMVQNCSVNIRFFYPPPRWPPALQRLQRFRTETARHAYSWPQVLSLCDPSTLPFGPGCAFPRCQKRTIDLWSQRCWEMVPDTHPPRSHGPMRGGKWSQHLSKYQHLSTDLSTRSISHGRYRRSMRIH